MQHVGHAEQRGGVNVMPAGMHQAGLGARPGQIRAFLNRQRVHIGANGQHRAGPAAIDDTDHAGLGDAGLMRNAHAGQLVGHHARGAYFLERQFRMRVQIAAHGDQVLFDLPGDPGDDGLDVIG